MPVWMIDGGYMLVVLLAATALFFFVATRGALIVRALSGGAPGDDAHVYPIYSNMRLIKLVDFQPVISAILLFQYHRLVSRITCELGRLDLRERKVLITSCAFGNVIPRVTRAASSATSATRSSSSRRTRPRCSSRTARSPRT
jgi:hypothetical protein